MYVKVSDYFVRGTHELVQLVFKNIYMDYRGISMKMMKLRSLPFIAVCLFIYGISHVKGLKIAVNAEQHMTVMEGTQNVGLNCPITGATLPVTYQWYHTAAGQGDGTQLQITASTLGYRLGKSALTITAVSRRDRGDFRAEVTDAAGGSGTCRFNLNVAYAPVFVNLPPHEIYVNLSQAFILDCVTDGNPTPTINWLKDGAKLGNRNNIIFSGSQLQFTKIETFDRGSYQCNATNQYGSVISPSTLIYVDVPLTFSSTPDSVTFLSEGQNVTLECNIDGYPHPTITWYKDNYQLNNDYHRTISRVYNELSSWSHLNFTSVKYTDSGMYTCEARNRNQVITFASEVIVQVLPKITTHHPKGMTVHIGDPFMLECRSTGTPPPTYTWFHNGKPIAAIADSHFETSRNDGKLFVRESFGTDAGRYYCHAVNNVGEVDSPTTVLYVEGLHFLKQPPPTVYILLGASKELDCEVAGTNETVEVDWYKDNKKLIPLCTSALAGDCPVDIRGTTLLLNQVSPDHEGTYMCIAKETGVTDPQQIIVRSDVNIMVHPEFSPALPAVIEGRYMGKLTINCTATGKPSPKIEWLKNGLHMHNDTYRAVKDGILYIRELHTRHNGKYTCAATNGAGTVVQVIRIHITSASATINATLMAVSSATATVSWQTNARQIHHFEMEYKERMQTTWKGIEANIPGDAREYTITDLAANTTYQLHMWAVNKQGIGQILTLEFSTLPANAEAAEGLLGNHLIILVSVVAIILCIILLLVCIVLTRKNSRIWISKKQEDGHSLMNNQHDTLASGSHVNPAFNSGGSKPKGVMELHDVSNYGSTTATAAGSQDAVVDTSA